MPCFQPAKDATSLASTLLDFQSVFRPHPYERHGQARHTSCQDSACVTRPRDDGECVTHSISTILARSWTPRCRFVFQDGLFLPSKANIDGRTRNQLRNERKRLRSRAGSESKNSTFSCLGNSAFYSFFQPYLYPFCNSEFRAARSRIAFHFLFRRHYRSSWSTNDPRKRSLPL